MQDEFHAEDQPEVTPDEPTSEPNEPNEAADEAPSTARPAATASSYRDIIAERLARKGGGKVSGSTPSPIAHSSDVERAQWPEASPTMQGSPTILPANIEAITKRQEISASEAVSGDGTSEGNEGPQSSRERALLRQQERAALRRGGAARPPRREPEMPILGELPFNAESDEPSVAEETAQPESDVIAARLARKGPDRGPRRPERRRAEDRPFEEPRREPSVESPRAPASPPPAAPSAGLTLRTARPAPRESEEPRRRESAPARRIEAAEPRIPASREKIPSAPEEKGAGAAVALAGKLGISVVIPLYNEQDSLRELTAALKQQLMRLAGPKYEILYVNDGSTDRSGEILEDILAMSSRVSTISFRRNLGKSAALAAGFAEAQYGIVITMDADLQDDPREFVNLIAKLSEGYDLVSGWKKKRQDPMSKTGPSKFFNWVTGMFSGIRLHDFNCGLKAYRKEVTDSLQVYGELHRYLPALAYWQGFRVTEIPVTHHPRKFGKSKFGSSRFFKGFLDLMSIVFTNRYGKRPLHLFGTVGTVMAIAGFVIDIWLTVEWALGLTSLSNRPILLLGLLLILVGVQLISIGLLGEMIVKNSISRTSLTYQKEKGRPSAEAQERRASRVAQMSRVGGRPPRPAGSERRAQPRRS